jgi:hypothetical protein
VSLYPKATVYAFDLSSSTNYFAYVLYENSVLRRKACGDAYRGLVLNEGALLEEELEVLNKSGNQDLVKHGEALAFNLCKRFFGCPFDEFDDQNCTWKSCDCSPPFLYSRGNYFVESSSPVLEIYPEAWKRT